MSDDPLHSILQSDRITLRCVLVSEGEDPSAALAEAGIIDAIALPVVIGDEPDLSSGMLGDGRTPNVTALLETEPEEAGLDAPPVTQPRSLTSSGDAPPPALAGTVNQPPAYGIQPIAPVRRREN